MFLLAPRHAEVWKMEVLLHAFWTSALDGGECAALCCHLTRCTGQEAVWVSEWLSEWVTEWVSDWVAKGGCTCCPVGIPRYCSPVRFGRCALSRERQMQMWCEMGTRWPTACILLWQWQIMVAACSSESSRAVCLGGTALAGVVLWQWQWQWQWRCRAALRDVCRRSLRPAAVLCCIQTLVTYIWKKICSTEWADWSVSLSV